LPASAISSGRHTIEVEISNPNATADNVNQDNTMLGSFRTIDPLQTLPFTETFTPNTFPPAGWNYVNFSSVCFMSRNATGGFGVGSGSLKMDNYSGPMDITGQKDYFISPRLDFSGASANTKLSFSVAYARYNNSSNDRLQVSASTDCGSTWTVIYDKAGAILSTAPNAANAFTPNATQWRSDTVNLGAYASQPEVMVMFTNTSNYGNNLYIDDINVTDLSTSLNDPSGSQEFSLYPNPVSGNIMHIRSDEFNGQVDYKISSASGQELLQSSVTVTKGSEIKIDVTGLAAGAYFIRITSRYGSTVKKLVKL